MYYDPIEGEYEKRSEEAYKVLKDTLRNDKITESSGLVLHHILKLEHEADKMKKELEEYRKFFDLLQKLTPKPFSINDVIH
jgi:hypothetical protein